MTISTPASSGDPLHVSQAAPQGILGIAPGKSVEVPFALLRSPIRGGLPPRMRQRVREHVEAHLERNISLQELAEIAGLSVSHFARAFKQSEGMTPHGYLIQRTAPVGAL